MRYFREPPGEPRTHIHVRRAGSFSEQFPLLFRDYLRHHPQDASEYENVKRQLADQHPHDGRRMPTPRPLSAGKSFTEPTSGRSEPDGRQARATRETDGAINARRPTGRQPV